MSQLLKVPNILVQKRAPKRARKCTRKRAQDGKWHWIDAQACGLSNAFPSLIRAARARQEKSLYDECRTQLKDAVGNMTTDSQSPSHFGRQQLFHCLLPPTLCTIVCLLYFWTLSQRWESYPHSSELCEALDLDSMARRFYAPVVDFAPLP